MGPSLAWILNILKNFTLHYHQAFNHKSSGTNTILSLPLHCSPLPIPVLSFKGWEKEFLYFLGFIKELLTQQQSHFVNWFPLSSLSISSMCRQKQVFLAGLNSESRFFLLSPLTILFSH